MRCVTTKLSSIMFFWKKMRQKFSKNKNSLSQGRGFESRLPLGQKENGDNVELKPWHLNPFQVFILFLPPNCRMQMCIVPPQVWRQYLTITLSKIETKNKTKFPKKQN